MFLPQIGSEFTFQGSPQQSAKIEQKEKSVLEAELELSIQKDIEQEERKAMRERETAWILHGVKYPDWGISITKTLAEANVFKLIAGQLLPLRRNN